MAELFDISALSEAQPDTVVRVNIGENHTFCRILSERDLSRVLREISGADFSLGIWVAYCWCREDGSLCLTGNLASRIKQAGKIRNPEFLTVFSKAAASVHNVGGDSDAVDEKNEESFSEMT